MQVSPPPATLCLNFKMKLPTLSAISQYLVVHSCHCLAAQCISALVPLLVNVWLKFCKTKLLYVFFMSECNKNKQSSGAIQIILLLVLYFYLTFCLSSMNGLLYLNANCSLFPGESVLKLIWTFYKLLILYCGVVLSCMYNPKKSQY